MAFSDQRLELWDNPLNIEMTANIKSLSVLMKLTKNDALGN